MGKREEEIERLEHEEAVGYDKQIDRNIRARLARLKPGERVPEAPTMDDSQPPSPLVYVRSQMPSPSSEPMNETSVGGFKIISSEDVPPGELWFCEEVDKQLSLTANGLVYVQHLRRVGKVTNIRP